MKFLKQAQQLYHFLQNQERIVQTSLLILSLLILFFCKSISGYFANYNVDYWFDYFVITERFSMLLLLLSAREYLKKLNWLTYELTFAFLLQDFIDRVILDIQVFNINDVICLTVIGIQLIIKTYVKFKK